MSKKTPYTKEQIRILEQNIFTHSVTGERLVFTSEFKQLFYDQCRIHGKSTMTILQEAGYDTSFFSKTQIAKIKSRILREGDSGEGFKPPRGLSTEQRTMAFESKDLSRQKTSATIKEMQERIVHLEKQVEFLKKISFIKNS